MSDDLLRIHEKFSQRDLWTLVKPQVRKAAAAAARHANADVLEQAQSWIKDAHVDRPLELVFRASWDALKFHEGVEWAHLHPTVVLVGGTPTALTCRWRWMCIRKLRRRCVDALPECRHLVRRASRAEVVGLSER